MTIGSCLAQGPFLCSDLRKHVNTHSVSEESRNFSEKTSGNRLTPGGEVGNILPRAADEGNRAAGRGRALEGPPQNLENRILFEQVIQANEFFEAITWRGPARGKETGRIPRTDLF